MPPPSYPHRHLLLTGLLETQPNPSPSYPDAFALTYSPLPTPNGRGCSLDALLLAAWSGSKHHGAIIEKDVLNHADSLRLKKADFLVLGRVGEGQFGVVDAVRCRLDGKVYAMKTIEKTRAIRAGSQLGLAYERNIHLVADASSPAPLLAATFQSPTSLHIVTAYAPCGSLWDRLCDMAPLGADTGCMDEEEIAWWARQMVAALAWVHGLGYAHRDVKPHNFLLLPDSRLWITDFGSAAPLVNGSVPRIHCALPAGTPDYVSPEVLRLAEDAIVEAAQSFDEESDGDRTLRSLQPGYGPDVDWWSLGATLYEMATGKAPFWAHSITATYDRIMRCDVRMPQELSQQLRSLLSRLLSPSDVRLGHSGVGEIRRHAFFANTDWSQLGKSPRGVVPRTIDIGNLAHSFSQNQDDGDEITFGHLFNNTTTTATPIQSGLLSNSVSIISTPIGVAQNWKRWIGWSWDPPSDFFGDEPPSLSPPISPPTHLLPLARVPFSGLAPKVDTPLRPIIDSLSPSSTVPRTAPHSVPRTRPVSERQAFAQLVNCVKASARKKISSSVNFVPSSVSSTDSVTSSLFWRKAHPPTPTPRPRDVTALTTSLVSARVKSDATDDIRPPSRTVSRPLSRASERDERPVSTARVRDEPSSRGSVCDGAHQPVLQEDIQVERAPSRSSARPETAAQRTSEWSKRQFKSTSTPNRVPATSSPTDSSWQRAFVQESPRPQVKSPSRDNKMDKMDTLEAWHYSLQDGLTVLERRLADMTTRMRSNRID